MVHTDAAAVTPLRPSKDRDTTAALRQRGSDAREKLASQADTKPSQGQRALKDSHNLCGYWCLVGAWWRACPCRRAYWLVAAALCLKSRLLKRLRWRSASATFQHAKGTILASLCPRQQRRAGGVQYRN